MGGAVGKGEGAKTELGEKSLNNKEKSGGGGV